MFSNPFFTKVLSDNQHGSGRVLNQAMESFKTWGSQQTKIERQKIIDTGQQLFKTFPNFAVLFHFLNELLLWTENQPPAVASQDLINWILNYEKHWSYSRVKASQNLLKNVPLSRKQILLHSNSSAVQTLFQEIKKKNLSCTIWQTVSSPANEGTLQAEFLAGMGFKIHLIHENEIWLFKNHFDLTILGSDLMTGDFFINKTATRSICLLDLPTYLLSETRKYIDESSLTPKLFSQLTTEPPKPDDELYQGKKTNIQVHNYYFEKTPLSKVKNIVLENGFFTPQSFKKIFPLQKISNYLTDSL